jgi:hypothetical protein
MKESASRYFQKKEEEEKRKKIPVNNNCMALLGMLCMCSSVLPYI